MMNLRSLGLVVLGITACRQAGSPQAGSSNISTKADTTDLVVVDRPTVIGFFPPAKDSAEANEDGYSEGVAHVGFALQDAEACLGKDSGRTVLVVDTAVRVRRDGRVDTLRFSHIDSLSYGAYLIRPGAQPKLINVYGPSQLIPAVAEAIPTYFDRGPCR